MICGKTLFVGKIVLLSAIAVAMFALGQKCGRTLQDAKNRDVSMPIYELCHRNFNLIPDDFRREYNIRDPYLTLVEKVTDE